MLQSLIDDNAEKAQIDFHEYLVNKIRVNEGSVSADLADAVKFVGNQLSDSGEDEAFAALKQGYAQFKKDPSKLTPKQKAALLDAVRVTIDNYEQEDEDTSALKKLATQLGGKTKKGRSGKYNSAKLNKLIKRFEKNKNKLTSYQKTQINQMIEDIKKGAGDNDTIWGILDYKIKDI